MTLLSVQIKKYGGELLAVMNGRQVSKHLFSILKAGAFLFPENLHFQKMSKVVCHAATMVLQGVPVRQYGKIPHSTEIALWIIPLSTREKSSGRSVATLSFAIWGLASKGLPAYYESPSSYLRYLSPNR